ncbi:hypothetical protein GJAV_G00190750 [Gymnothorax javanicus]|nr:hypothetical protein GJAV_G00190750 [Gymnothorax javanicus]
MNEGKEIYSRPHGQILRMQTPHPRDLKAEYCVTAVAHSIQKTLTVVILVHLKRSAEMMRHKSSGCPPLTLSCRPLLLRLPDSCCLPLYQSLPGRACHVEFLRSQLG